MYRNSKNWTSITLRKEVRDFLNEIKKAKGFNSVGELIYNCTKACEFYSRGQIIMLASIESHEATEEDFEKTIKPKVLKIPISDLTKDITSSKLEKEVAKDE